MVRGVADLGELNVSGRVTGHSELEEILVRGKSHQVVRRLGKRLGCGWRWRGLLPTSVRGLLRWLHPTGPLRRCGGLQPCGCGPGCCLCWRRRLFRMDRLGVVLARVGGGGCSRMVRGWGWSLFALPFGECA